MGTRLNGNRFGTLSGVQYTITLQSLMFKSSIILEHSYETELKRVIAGLPLTSANYAKCIQLLKERFAQPHKIINAHMEALLSIPSPIDHLNSLRLFYDSVETHIRGLKSLGKKTET